MARVLIHSALSRDEGADPTFLHTVRHAIADIDFYAGEFRTRGGHFAAVSITDGDAANAMAPKREVEREQQ